MHETLVGWPGKVSCKMLFILTHAFASGFIRAGSSAAAFNAPDHEGGICKAEQRYALLTSVSGFV
jgi:hypothetical protein